MRQTAAGSCRSLSDARIAARGGHAPTSGSALRGTADTVFDAAASRCCCVHWLQLHPAGRRSADGTGSMLGGVGCAWGGHWAFFFFAPSLHPYYTATARGWCARGEHAVGLADDKPVRLAAMLMHEDHAGID